MHHVEIQGRESPLIKIRDERFIYVMLSSGHTVERFEYYVMNTFYKVSAYMTLCDYSVSQLYIIEYVI